MESLRRKISVAEAFEPIENDKEYFYALGQLATFINNCGDKQNCDDVVRFIRSKNAAELKKKIITFFKKNAHGINKYNKKFNNLMSMVVDYEPTTNEIDEQTLLAGITSNSLLFE